MEDDGGGEKGGGRGVALNQPSSDHRSFTSLNRSDTSSGDGLHTYNKTNKRGVNRHDLVMQHHNVDIQCLRKCTQQRERASMA